MARLHYLDYQRQPEVKDNLNIMQKMYGVVQDGVKRLGFLSTVEINDGDEIFYQSDYRGVVLVKIKKVISCERQGARYEQVVKAKNPFYGLVEVEEIKISKKKNEKLTYEIDVIWKGREEADRIRELRRAHNEEKTAA
mgnify:CR=1 FL=1